MEDICEYFNVAPELLDKIHISDLLTRGNFLRSNDRNALIDYYMEKNKITIYEVIQALIRAFYRINDLVIREIIKDYKVDVHRKYEKPFSYGETDLMELALKHQKLHLVRFLVDEYHIDYYCYHINSIFSKNDEMKYDFKKYIMDREIERQRQFKIFNVANNKFAF
jgi:hypothetical protein